MGPRCVSAGPVCDPPCEGHQECQLVPDAGGVCVEPCGEDFCVQQDSWDKYCVDGSCEPVPEGAVLCPEYAPGYNEYCDCKDGCDVFSETFCGCEAAQAEDCCGGGPE